jgi:hypothetical protein
MNVMGAIEMLSVYNSGWSDERREKTISKREGEHECLLT